MKLQLLRQAASLFLVISFLNGANAVIVQKSRPLDSTWRWKRWDHVLPQPPNLAKLREQNLANLREQRRRQLEDQANAANKWPKAPLPQGDLRWQPPATMVKNAWPYWPSPDDPGPRYSQHTDYYDANGFSVQNPNYGGFVAGVHSSQGFTTATSAEGQPYSPGYYDRSYPLFTPISPTMPNGANYPEFDHKPTSTTTTTATTTTTTPRLPHYVNSSAWPEYQVKRDGSLSNWSQSELKGPVTQFMNGNIDMYHATSTMGFRVQLASDSNPANSDVHVEQLALSSQMFWEEADNETDFYWLTLKNGDVVSARVSVGNHRDLAQAFDGKKDKLQNSWICTMDPIGNCAGVYWFKGNETRHIRKISFWQPPSHVSIGAIALEYWDVPAETQNDISTGSWKAVPNVWIKARLKEDGQVQYHNFERLQQDTGRFIYFDQSDKTQSDQIPAYFGERIDANFQLVISNGFRWTITGSRLERLSPNGTLMERGYTGVSEIEIFEELENCGDFKFCPEHWRIKPERSSMKGATVVECCEEVCTGVICPTFFALKFNASQTPGNSVEVCCVKECHAVVSGHDQNNALWAENVEPKRHGFYEVALTNRDTVWANGLRVFNLNTIGQAFDNNWNSTNASWICDISCGNSCEGIYMFTSSNTLERWVSGVSFERATYFEQGMEVLVGDIHVEHWKDEKWAKVPNQKRVVNPKKGYRVEYDFDPVRTQGLRFVIFEKNDTTARQDPADKGPAHRFVGVGEIKIYEATDFSNWPDCQDNPDAPMALNAKRGDKISLLREFPTEQFGALAHPPKLVPQVYPTEVINPANPVGHPKRHNIDAFGRPVENKDYSDLPDPGYQWSEAAWHQRDFERVQDQKPTSETVKEHARTEEARIREGSELLSLRHTVETGGGRSAARKAEKSSVSVQEAEELKLKISEEIMKETMAKARANLQRQTSSK